MINWKIVTMVLTIIHHINHHIDWLSLINPSKNKTPDIIKGFKQ